MIFKTIQDEIKRRATRDQSGTQFDTAVKNIINTSLFRLSREGMWRSLRRKGSFTTVTSYTEGTGAAAVTEDSTAVTITGATLLTDGVQVGRYIKFDGSGTYYKIDTITGETTLTLDKAYDGDTATDAEYEILPQEEYNLPIQAGHRTFLWHKEYGYPYQMGYVTDQSFYSSGAYDTNKAIPTHYRMWSEDMVITPLLEPSVMRVFSSVITDTSQAVTIFGTVSGYPDFEQVSLTGTAAASGSKLFTMVERVVKDASTTGRITVDANSGNTTVAVLPVGDTTDGIQYRKVQLYPLPNSAFDINVWYYKDPYRLVNDYDIHELGQDFDEAIICLSVSKIKYETSQAEGDKWFGLYKDELRTLRKTNTDKPDWLPTLKKPGSGRGDDLIHPQLRASQVGSYFGIRTRR
jgi:hypothetical protein